MIKDIFIISLLLGVVISVCPNNCNAHGRCIDGSCVCFDLTGVGDGKSYTGNDCSLLKCPEGNPLFASGSSYPVSSGSDFGYFVRELYENKQSSKRELIDSTMTIVGDAIDSTTGIYKVTTETDFFKPLPKIGGYIQCSYTPSGSDTIKDGKIEVIGVSDDKSTAYIELGGEIKADTPVTCNEILSSRKSMVYYGPNHVISAVTRRQLATGDGTLTWSKYGVIFKDLGILQPPPTQPVKPSERRNLEGEITYTNDKFKFVCYTSPSNVLTEYSATATYTEPVDPAKPNDDLTFTLSKSSQDLSTSSYCYCLMDGNVTATTVDKTELMEIVTKDKDNKYYIGKYIAGTAGEEKDENGYSVIILSGILTVGSGVTSVDITLTSASPFISSGRVVYVDVLADNKISEKVGEITDVSESTFKLSQLAANDIILPYIKMHSSNPTIPTTPNGNVVEGNLFIVYSLADVIISQLNKNVGGKLQCSYDKDVSIVVDVKGYEKSEKNHVYYSYIQFPVEITADNIATVKCSKIISKRKDFTLYNPLKLDTALTDNKLTWTGYAEILKDIKFDGVNFACYNPEEVEGEDKDLITVYDKVTVTKPNPADSGKDVLFTISVTSPLTLPTEGSICYLSATSDGKGITDLMESDLSSYIRKDGEKYYFGKYEKPDEGKIKVVPDPETLTPVFILDNSNNAITTNTIKIDESQLQSDDLEYFEVGKTIYIEVVGKDNIPYFHKATIIQPRERILATVEKTIYYNPPIPTDVTPTGVISVYPVNEEITLTPIYATDKLYTVTNFFDDLISKLPQKFGGKLQCKYIKTTIGSDPANTEAVAGFADVKGYIKTESESYAYIQFDHPMKSKSSASNPTQDPPVIEYYIEDVVCTDIISIRNDMSLYNPTSVSGDKITWNGYGSILTEIGFIIPTEPVTYTFTCYNPTNKMMKDFITSPITIPESGDVVFTFTNPPTDGDMCYLLADKEGKPITIQSSELSDYVRVENGEYYYGKYVDVEENKYETIQNDDGSVTQILGKGLFTDKEEENDSTKDMINIAKLNNPDSPSIAYPPSLISDGIKKLMVSGTTMIFLIDGTTQSTQILKVIVNEKDKFELSLSKPISYTNSPPRLLSNTRSLLPTSPLTITFSTEGSVHKSLECSGQGSCDRTSGICSCYDGFSGSACQRLDCPNNCNGNGRCVALSELLSNEDLKDYDGYGNKRTINEDNKDVEFDDQIFGCLCDKRHRGYDCSLIECPSGLDPEEATNGTPGSDEYRDCSGRGICNYSTGVCECFDGFSGEGCQNQVQMM